ESDLFKTCLATLLNRQIEVERRAFVARAVALPIGKVENFLSFSQANDQRMIAPLAFVIHTNTLFLLTAGFDHGTVGLNRGLFQKALRLLFPDQLTRPVDPLHQHQQLLGIETPAKIPSGRWIRNTDRAECVE